MRKSWQDATMAWMNGGKGGLKYDLRISSTYVWQLMSIHWESNKLKREG